MLCLRHAGHTASAALVRGAPFVPFMHDLHYCMHEFDQCILVKLGARLSSSPASCSSRLQRSFTIMADVHGASGSRTGNGHPQKSQSGGKKPLAVHLGGLQNLLKLRTTYRFNERLSGLIGADLNVQQQTAFPVATLQYEVRPTPAGFTSLTRLSACAQH